QDAFTLDVLEVTQGSGSGFVWDKSGHIVTNFHVIRGASDLRLVGTTECFMLSYYTFLVVWLCSNRSLSILVLMVDRAGRKELWCFNVLLDKDVVVLRIKAPKDKLRPIPVGVSADLLVGQKVYAIGNPPGSDASISDHDLAKAGLGPDVYKRKSVVLGITRAAVDPRPVAAVAAAPRPRHAVAAVPRPSAVAPDPESERRQLLCSNPEMRPPVNNMPDFLRSVTNCINTYT
ncbi:hypothetical protein ACJX0J_031504, partial [Zea mays]